MKDDPQIIELVRTCAAKIDDGLAPLVAGGIVHRDLARMLGADLRKELARTTCDRVWAEASLPRTAEAVAIMDAGEAGEQLSSVGAPCPICEARNGEDEIHCWGCGAPLTNGVAR